MPDLNLMDVIYVTFDEQQQKWVPQRYMPVRMTQIKSIEFYEFVDSFYDNQNIFKVTFRNDTSFYTMENAAKALIKRLEELGCQ